jgi:hypothetical protein
MVKAEKKREATEHATPGERRSVRITPGNVKNIIRVAKVAAPVLAPFVLKAVSAARESLDRMRARRLGVPVDELSRFTGKGAALHARIASDTDALRDLHASGDQESASFANAARDRLAKLTSAVGAAERMPAARRRAVHRSVAGELGRLEDDLLRRLGVSGKN